MKTIYKLVKVVKVSERELFDRSSLEGDCFEFDRFPEVGSRFSVRDIDSGKYLTTSIVTDVLQAEDNVEITTKNSVYTFSAVEGSENEH